MSVTRREFVKTAAAAAGAYAVGGIGVRAYARGSDTIKVGIVGCGGRGTGAAVQALRADPGCMLTAMGDLFPDRVAASHKNIGEALGEQAAQKVQVPEEHKFVGFDSYQKVIDSGVDLVILTGYPNSRPEHLKAAIAAGKHVFCEKPVAVDAPGIRSVLASAREAKERNLGLQVGFCWRYNDGMRGAFEKVHSGAIGDIVSVHTTYHTSTLGRRPRRPEWSDLEFQMRNWWHFTWISGDHIVEQAVHSVDRMAWAMGDRLPTRVTCLGGRAARSGEEHGNVFDHFAAVYEYEGGTRAFHTCRQIDGCPSDNADYIYGTHGQAVVEGWKPIYSVRDLSGKETWKYTRPADQEFDRDMYQNEHDELMASIRAGRPINDCERGANSTMMAIMARMAAYTGKTVTWKDAMESQENLTPEKLEFGPMPTPEVAVPGKTKFV